MALIKSVKDEEERKRKLQAQSNQSAQSAANKSAQMNSDAAKKNSAGVTKKPAMSAADTIAAAKQKAATGSVTKTPAQHANKAKYVKQTTTKRSYDYKTLGTQERVDQIAGRIADPKEKQGFLDGWTAYTESKGYKSEQKRKAQLQGLAGLYDANGMAININTASYSTVVQGIRSIADATKRKEAAAKLEEMTKTWGSRFYGQTYTKDIVTSYLGNPDFSEDDYKEEVKLYQDAFYAQSGYEKENGEQYLSFYQGIAESSYSDSVKRQLKEALDVSYQNSTGKKAPDVRTLAAAQNAPQSASEQTDEETVGNKKNPLAEAWNAVTDFFDGDNKQAEEATEEAPTEEKRSFGDQVLDVISGKPLMDEEWVEDYENREETPKISQEPGYQGAYASATVSDVPGIVKPSQQKRYIDVKDDADVLRAFYAGKIDEVDPAVARGFLNMISNPYAKQLLGTVADETDAKSALVGNVGAEMVGLSNLTALGNAFYDAYATINGESFPDELRDDGMLVLLDLTKRATLLEEQGKLGGDENLPAMERLLTTDEYAQWELNKLYEARDALISNRNSILTAQQRATDKAIADAREAFAKGEASEQQIQLVYDSVPADAPKKAYKDKTYKRMNDFVYSWDDGYFSEDGGEFYNTALYANLPKTANIDDYKCALSTQMCEVLKLDARAAASLGMGLEDFYAKMGGMSYNTIANRASAKMTQEAKSITPEDAQAIDAVTSDGSIGWAATGGLAVSHGVLNTYEAYADTLYMGVTEGNVIRVGEKMKIQYEQEYGTIEGRAAYRDELQDYIDSGLLDESYAKALQNALDNVSDVYSIGIDPADAEGFIVKSGAWARRNAQMQAAYIYENASDAEREAFNVVAGAVQNGLQMAVSAAGTVAAGAALGGIPTTTAKGAKAIQKLAGHFGFAVGYDAGQWSQNVESRMDEGYGRDTAVWLGSTDTLGGHMANYMTFDNILGRATGLNTLATNMMNWSMSNPIGTLKGMAAVKAFTSGLITGAQNITEEIGDTFKEGMVQSSIDKWLVPLFQKADNGEDVKATDVLGALLSAVNPKELANNAVSSAQETLASAPEIALQTSLFAIAGAVGNANATYKGYRTAQSMPIQADGIAAYDSVQMATDIVNGRSNDVQGFLEAFKTDLEDDKFIRLFNEAAQTQGLAHKTAMNMIRANGSEEKIKMITAKQEQIKAHEAKAEASQTAIDTAVENMAVSQQKIDNGTADDTDVQVVIDSAESIAKNKTSLDESTREAEQRKAEVKELQDEMMQEARAKANRQQQAELDRLNEQITDMRVTSRQQQEADNVTALEADNFVNERYPNATPEQRKRLIEQYNAVVKGRVDSEFKSVDMAVRQFKKKFKNINFTVVDSLAGSEGGYVRDKNTVYIARDMTYGEIANRVITHELTHAAEAGGKAYEQLRDALINLRYKGDKNQLRADIVSKQNRYNDHFTQNNIMDDATGTVKKLSEEEAMQEIVAQINSEILSGNEEMINRLVAEEPSVARRIWETVKDFLQKVGVIKDTEIDQLRRVESMFEKALNQAQTNHRDFGTDGVQYSIREKQPPKNVVYAYKAFYARDGKLYPPMVANITDESDKQKVKGATSGTMKSLPTPVGVWLDADVGGIMTDENGEPVRAKDTKRLRVKNDKSGGSATLAFRPGWHLGEWPDAKQFNKADPVTGERGKRMPDDLVFAKCEVSADIDYQLDALSYGINEKGGFSRSQAGLPEIPEDGYYKYRTNVDPTTAPWLIAGSIKVTEILDDDDCARICAEFGVTPDKRVSGEKIDLAKYGLKRGPVEETTEGMEKFRENDANRANKALLDRALSDPNYPNAYVQRDIDFDNPAQYEQLKKEFAMNGQDIEQYKKLYETRGFASERRAQPVAENKSTGEALVGEVKGSAMQFSLRSWTDDERDIVRNNLTKRGFNAADVERWIGDVDGVARIIAADKDRLDFTAADNQVMLKPNQEYVKTLDASTLCAKRLLYQGTFNAIQHAMPDSVITSDGLIKLRNMMAEMGYETPCGICYVESRRRNLGTFAKQWLDGYDAKGGYQPKLDDVTTTDGLERMRTEHPEVYKSFTDEMNRKGSNNPKVVQLRTDYRGDIRSLTKKQAEKIVEIGGLRVQSFSDFETPHLLDMMQAVLDMTDKGLTSQAYTKVPNFAAVFGDTGIKINLSLIADGNGLDENGNLKFSSYEGMDFDRAMELREMYSKNVGTILVGVNDDHIKAAMADPRIDFIIPFHKSGWGQKQLESLTGMRDYEDYTADQNEKRVKGQTKGGKTTYKNVEENFHPVDYWDYSKTGKENAEEYLRMCAEDGRIPKFSQFLTGNGDGSYSLPEDGSADGYWKLLIDFKMYDNDGVGSPQVPVQPNFNMDEARRVLDEYEGGADSLPVAEDVVERYVKEESVNGSELSIPKGEMQHSLPSNDVVTREMQAYHELQTQPEAEDAQQIPNQDQQPKQMGERQFTVKTLQNSPAVPQWIKDELYSNPEARFYEKDTNNDQIVRSWERLQSEGYEAMRDRVLSSDAQNPDNVADANMIMAVANREGDVQTFLDVALHYAKEGTQTAKTLQARKIFSKMTPTGMKVWVSGQAENKLAKFIDEHKPLKRQVDTKAKKVAEKIKDLQGGNELLRLQAASEYTITAEDAKWGVPLNEKQRALIKEYGLENVARPGINYNRATTKQRMLEAILAEPNPEVKINGLSLLHRLELMKANVPVITTADISYMGEQMGIYARSPVDDQEGRVGDLALARLYEAYGNITPATMAEKLKSWRYTSMLLSVPSAARNVIGNAAQNTVNASAHGVARALDSLVSLGTGERTVAGLTLAERADGWRAFAEETKNTFRDFYTDKAITSHGEDRHNLNQRGRVYQDSDLFGLGGIAEMMRLTEGFLMSVGDRNFWKKAYVNSLAEQQRVADLNGEAFDYEAACARAEAEANYATFNEDSSIRDLLAQFKNPPEDASIYRKAAATVVDFLMPFTGVPTNITKRMIQYSPAGLAITAFEHGVKAAQGKNFDQYSFVNGMARGLTGTALFAIGAELLKAGLIHLGTGEEEDKKIYGAETAQGRQYTPYIRVGDQYIALSTFMPAGSALIMGATAAKVFEEDEDALNALKSACFASLDMIFDASYMSSLADVFGGYGTIGENAVDALVNSTISQNVPAILGQIASAMDPYVRDTKDKNAIMQALKSGLIAKIPGLREQLLEAKVDITGEKVRNSKYLVAPIDPFTRSYANDDPVLQELIDFARESGDSGVIPELFVASNKYNVKITKTQAKELMVNRAVGENGKRDYQALSLDVTDEEKWALNEKYGKLVFSELANLVSSRKWERKSEADRIKLAKEIISEAKLDVLEDFLKERGVK